VTLEKAVSLRKSFQEKGLRVVFTNGCFDLVHGGHVHLLEEAGKQGDRLIVGLNSDESIRRIKPRGRPILSEDDRADILRAFEVVDVVVLFDEDTPLRTIKRLEPDVLVKGADYARDEIVGADWIDEHGGRIHRVPLKEGKGTTQIIREIQGSTIS